MAWQRCLCGVAAAAVLLSPAESQSGCTDSGASNFLATVTNEDGSCEYVRPVDGVCPQLAQKVGAPVGAKCYMYAQGGDLWGDELASLASTGPQSRKTLTVDGAWIVQGVPQAGGTMLTPQGPELQYRFSVGSDDGGEGDDLTLRYAKLTTDGSGQTPSGGCLLLQQHAVARLHGVMFTEKASNARTGGAIYANRSSVLEVAYSVFGASQSLKGGGINADAASVSVTACQFVKAVAMSHEGGGIYCINCAKVHVVDTVFDGCTANGDKGGDALALESCTDILIKGTAFIPFNPIKSVYFNSSWLQTVGGCAEHPCEAGFGCT